MSKMDWGQVRKGTKGYRQWGGWMEGRTGIGVIWCVMYKSRVSENSMDSMRVIPGKFPNIGGYRAGTGHFL